MSALDPSGPAQPTQADAYTTNANPASKEPAEATAARNVSNNAATVEQRVPQKQSSSIEDATPSSLARGIHGAPPGEEAQGKTQEEVGRNQELDAEQMAAPGEKRVWQAVEGGDGKPGSGGEQMDLASDLDRKKAEQAPQREAIEQQRQKNVDVGGILGQRGGPANPVDKNNYPNSGD